MFRHDLVVALAEAVLELGRPLDVSEEEANRPTGQVGHVSIVTPARSDSKARRAMVVAWPIRASSSRNAGRLGPPQTARARARVLALGRRQALCARE
jgi:hypothetical protein